MGTVVARYCCCGVTHRFVQMVGKTFDTFGPIGPAIVTKDEVGDVHNLAIKCHVSGEVHYLDSHFLCLSCHGLTHTGCVA